MPPVCQASWVATEGGQLNGGSECEKTAGRRSGSAGVDVARSDRAALTTDHQIYQQSDC